MACSRNPVVEHVLGLFILFGNGSNRGLETVEDADDFRPPPVREKLYRTTQYNTICHCEPHGQMDGAHLDETVWMESGCSTPEPRLWFKVEGCAGAGGHETCWREP